MQRIGIVVGGVIAFLLSAASICRATEPPPFNIQAHRCAGIAMPENTLESVEWSWKRGITPEVDLRLTKDDQIVCFHDANFARVPTNVDEQTKKLGVEKLSLAELQRLDVGSFRGSQYAGQRIPTLASILAEMRGRPERLLYIDIKKIDLDQLSALVREYGAERQCIFTTAHYDLLRAWKKRVPESPTLLWNGSTEQQRPNHEKVLAKKMDDLRQQNFNGITYLQIHVFVGDLASDEPFEPRSEFLRTLGKELKSRGIVFQVLPWECADPRAYEKLLALGAESFATDYPEVTVNAVKKFRDEHAKN
jgi:glycerophosphoryl diester phosphodiesterase